MPSADPTIKTSSLTPSPISPKPFSISLPIYKAKPSPSVNLKTLNPKKRPYSTLADSDSDNEGTNRGPQLVSSFDHSAGGAIGIGGVEKPKAPLVIRGQKNRDWRQEIRRSKGKNILPAEEQAARAGTSLEAKEAEGAETPKAFGLTFMKREVRDQDGNVAMGDLQAAQMDPDFRKLRSADEEAMEALMGDGSKKSTLVLPALDADGENGDSRKETATGAGNEDDLFKSDVASRPDMASLDDYAAVPVEEFGAALLRGMGWKEGDVVGKRKDQIIKHRVVERRPALLGIGAKEIPGSEELGAWGKAAKGKKKADKTYNPVLLRNSKTGEMLTEEELEAKKENQKKEELDWRERRDRNLAIDSTKKRESRDAALLTIESGKKGTTTGRDVREKPRSHESSRHSSSGRERSRSPESRRHNSSSSASSSRRERSRSTDSRRSRRRDHDDHDHRDGDRRRRDRHDEKSSKHRHRARDDYEDTKRRSREEVC